MTGSSMMFYFCIIHVMCTKHCVELKYHSCHFMLGNKQTPGIFYFRVHVEFGAHCYAQEFSANDDDNDNDYYCYYDNNNNSKLL